MFLRPVLLIAGLLVLASLTGCKSIASLKQRCLTGEVTSCESACAKGVSGEGGCFHAGNLHRERATLDFDGPEFKRASEYFVKSCDGGYGEGCLLSAELIEAPYAPDPSATGSAAPKAIADTELKTREKRLERACSLGSSAGCKRLGDVLIGKAAARAEAAYAKACKVSSAPADCSAARKSEVEQAERWRTGCVGQLAADCTRLGDLLYQVDPPRAVRLFISECQLRQVADFVGGVGQFVHDRIAQVNVPVESARAPGPQNNGKNAFDVASPTVQGPVAVAELLHLFALHGPDLGACVPAGAPPPEVPIEMIVDATGAVYRAEISGNAPPEMARCIRSVVLGLTFARPSTAARVNLTLRPAASVAKPQSVRP